MLPGKRLNTRKKDEILSRISTGYYLSRHVAEQTADRILERHPMFLEGRPEQGDTSENRDSL